MLPVELALTTAAGAPEKTSAPAGTEKADGAGDGEADGASSAKQGSISAADGQAHSDAKLAESEKAYADRASGKGFTRAFGPWGFLLTYFYKWKGVNEGLFPPFPTFRIMFWSWIGAFCGIATVAAMTYNTPWYLPEDIVDAKAKLVFIIGSFGASAVLIYGAIDSPLAQPRNFVGGHVVSAISGIVVAEIFGAAGIGYDDETKYLWFQCGIAVASAIVAMQACRFVHPPGGATALIAVTSPKTLRIHGLYIVVPVLTGALVMLVVALIVDNLQRQYPLYWWRPRVLDVPMVDPDSTHHTGPGEEFGPHVVGPISPGGSLRFGAGGSVHSSAGGSMRAGSVGGSVRSGRGTASHHGDGSLRRGEAFAPVRFLSVGGEGGSMHKVVQDWTPLTEIKVQDSSVRPPLEKTVSEVVSSSDDHKATTRMRRHTTAESHPATHGQPANHRSSWNLHEAHMKHKHHLVDQSNIDHVLACLDHIVSQAQGPAQKEIWRAELERALHRIQTVQHPVWQEKRP